MSKQKDSSGAQDLETFVTRALSTAFDAFGIRCAAEILPRASGAREPLAIVLKPGEPDNLGPRRWTQLAQAVGTLVEAGLTQQGAAEMPVVVTLPEPAPGVPRASREAQGLEAAAQALAEAAQARGRAFALGPMGVGDRRLVHQALGDVPGVWTQSAGEGIYRRLWVVPRTKLAESLDASSATADDTTLAADESDGGAKR